MSTTSSTKPAMADTNGWTTVARPVKPIEAATNKKTSPASSKASSVSGKASVPSTKTSTAPSLTYGVTVIGYKTRKAPKASHIPKSANLTASSLTVEQRATLPGTPTINILLHGEKITSTRGVVTAFCSKAREQAAKGLLSTECRLLGPLSVPVVRALLKWAETTCREKLQVPTAFKIGRFSLVDVHYAVHTLGMNPTMLGLQESSKAYIQQLDVVVAVNLWNDANVAKCHSLSSLICRELETTSYMDASPIADKIEAYELANNVDNGQARFVVEAAIGKTSNIEDADKVLTYFGYRKVAYNAARATAAALVEYAILKKGALQCLGLRGEYRNVVSEDIQYMVEKEVKRLV